MSSIGTKIQLNFILVCSYTHVDTLQVNNIISLTDGAKWFGSIFNISSSFKYDWITGLVPLAYTQHNNI